MRQFTVDESNKIQHRWYMALLGDKDIYSPSTGWLYGVRVVNVLFDTNENPEALCIREENRILPWNSIVEIKDSPKEEPSVEEIKKTEQLWKMPQKQNLNEPWVGMTITALRKLLEICEPHRRHIDTDYAIVIDSAWESIREVENRHER